MDFKEKSTIVIAHIVSWFTSAVFIWWGWNIFARYFSLPQFEYMEVFAMRMALTYIMKIIWQKADE